MNECSYTVYLHNTGSVNIQHQVNAYKLQNCWEQSNLNDILSEQEKTNW